ncbi:exosome complex component RRP41 isoform X2 [Myotis myotis]|uniref:exosome complex component RRP41 isoform X2 n=1 Tax=Myotis myotis TaxID=51298 RepID=UPI00174DB3FA|nr:exosome complex component RRP41 isoform X2 [Myotis myotis]
MAGLELLSDQGYRVDGRRAGELRKIQARMGVFSQADGSAYIEQGNTKALAVVYGPHEIRGSRSRALPDRALVNCQYSSATFSTGERKRRPHGDRKSCEMGLQLRQTFEAAILTQLHPRSQIDIYVQPLWMGLPAGAAGRRWDLRRLCECSHAGRAGCGDTNAGLCVCLLSGLCGRHSPGGPQPRRGSSWRPPAGPGPAASLGPDRTA